MKLNKRIGITFIVAILLINLVSLSFMNILTSNSFNQYLGSKSNYLIDEIQTKLEDENINSEEFSVYLNQLSAAEDIYVKIENNNAVVFESDVSSNEHHDSMMHEDDYSEYSESVTVDNTEYNIVIGQYKNHMATASESEFVNKINFAHLASFVISIVIGIVATIIISRQFSRPITILNKNLKYIAKGYYNTHDELKTSIYEMNQLNDSSNQIRKSLNEQDQIRQDLVMNLSHDLRTPLTVVKTSLEAMSDGVIEVNSENIEAASMVVERVISIVDQLDDLNDISRNVVNKTRINISNELNNILDIYTGTASKKDIKINRNIESDVYMLINVDHFNQIIQNLMSNAIKYNIAFGEVNVKLITEKSSVIIEVSDTGVGIDNDDISYIFDRFYRCDKSRHVEEGSGVGLSIVKSLVESNNGDIMVASKKESGSTFKVVFDIKGENNE